MLTTWGKRVAAAATVFGYSLPYVTLSATSKALIPAKSIAGTALYIPAQYFTNPAFTSIVNAFVATGSDSSIGVAFGSDDTEATENDYTLGSQVTGITTNSPSIETFFDTANNKYVARLDYVISNDTGATVTIAEVGFFVRFGSTTTQGAAASTSGNNRVSVMMDRTVLNTPVVIANGDAATVRYEFAY